MSERPFPIRQDDDDPMARLLRRALAEEAHMVRTNEDAYGRLTKRIADEQPRRRSWAPWVAGLAAAAVAGIAVGATFLGGDDRLAGPAVNPASPPAESSGPAESPAPSSPAETSGTGEAGTADALPVYWVGQSQTTSWLYREFREGSGDGDGAIDAALTVMLEDEPLDPDYTNPWSPSDFSTTRDGDGVTVDLTPAAFADGNVGSEMADRAVQQLVHTVTAAASLDGSPASTVTVTVDGEAYDAWGTVRLGEPMQRQAAVDVQAPTWVVTPQHGATVDAGTVSFSGVGTAFEGNFLWEVRDADGQVVADGFTTGGSMGTFDEFEFEAQLEPGEYTVEVYQPDESGGESDEGPRMYPDTKEFTVR